MSTEQALWRRRSPVGVYPTSHLRTSSEMGRHWVVGGFEASRGGIAEHTIRIPNQASSRESPRRDTMGSIGQEAIDTNPCRKSRHTKNRLSNSQARGIYGDIGGSACGWSCSWRRDQPSVSPSYLRHACGFLRSRFRTFTFFKHLAPALSSGQRALPAPNAALIGCLNGTSVLLQSFWHKWCTPEAVEPIGSARVSEPLERCGVSNLDVSCKRICTIPGHHPAPPPTLAIESQDYVALRGLSAKSKIRMQLSTESVSWRMLERCGEQTQKPGARAGKIYHASMTVL